MYNSKYPLLFLLTYGYLCLRSQSGFFTMCFDDYFSKSELFTNLNLGGKLVTQVLINLHISIVFKFQK